ncbi:MAG TPA: 6-phosphogluconolactonase [Allosphingosinicella sp.]|jgi:6-phosphogluconolactonase
MDEIEWWEFDSAAEMATQVAGDIGFIIERALEAHKDARLAVPGGSTPDLVYAELVKRKDIDWSQVTLIPTDDRLVPLADAASNHGKLEGYFGAKKANIVPLVDEAALSDYKEAGRLADARLSLLQWPLDLACLGMGADGSVAGIFPGGEYDAAINGPRSRRAIGLRPDPMPQGEKADRVTLTAAALASARTVMVMITGDEKRRVLEQAIKEGPLASAPIGRVLANIEVPIDIFWCPEA